MVTGLLLLAFLALFTLGFWVALNVAGRTTDPVVRAAVRIGGRLSRPFGTLEEDENVD